MAVKPTQVIQEREVPGARFELLEQGNGWQRLRSRWRRPERIRGQQVGDVTTDRPVILERGAVLAGNIIAPKVVVAGLLYGYVVTRDVVVKEGGQVWGDIYAATWQIDAGGVVHGWSSTPDETVLSVLAQGESTMPARTMPAGLLPPELAGEVEDRPPDTEGRLAMLHHLQAEIATALVSRAELEHNFEERLQELAGDAFAQLHYLQDEIEAERQELAETYARLNENQHLLQQREREIQKTREELAEARALLDEQAAGLQNLQVLFGQKVAELGSVQAANELLEEQVQDSIFRVDTYTSRVESLESALQASLQRTAEQEEALLRWQELAEVTQLRLREVQGELESARLQLTESERVIERLREQRSRIEEAWLEASDELEVLREQREAGAKEAAGSAQEEAPADVENNLQQLQREEYLWQKAEKELTQATIQRLQEALAQRDESISQWQRSAQQQQVLADNWKGTVGRMSELLYTAEQRAAEAESRLQKLENAAAQASQLSQAEYEALREQVRQQKLQLEAMETEVEHYHRELQMQGRRLSEVQAELVEKHLAVQEAEQAAAGQAQENERIRQAAAQRIRTLENELATVQRQLKDLMAWVERRRSKE